MNIQSAKVITADEAKAQGVSLSSLYDLVKWHRKKAEKAQKNHDTKIAIRHSAIIGKINKTIRGMKG